MALKIPFNRSEPGFWVSGVAHAAMLAAGLFTVSGAKFPDAQEGIPVEIITDNQFSEITKGEKQAEKVQPNPRPRADRVAERQEQRDPGEAKVDAPAPPTRPADMQVADKEQLAPTPPPSPPPAAAARAEQQKREEAIKLAERQEAEAAAQAKAAAEAKAKAEAEAKAKAEAEARSEARRVAEAKAKAEAEAKARAEAKRREEEKKAQEAKARKEADEAKTFDVGDIRQLLANKEKHQSTGASGSEVQKTASLGTQTGNAQRLNPSMRDALVGLLRDQMERCFTAPVAASAGDVTAPFLDIRLNQDGSLATEPSIIRAGANATDRAVAEAALRAVRRCAPYRVPAQFAPFYSDWRVLNVEFSLS